MLKKSLDSVAGAENGKGCSHAWIAPGPRPVVFLGDHRFAARNSRSAACINNNNDLSSAYSLWQWLPVPT